MADPRAARHLSKHLNTPPARYAVDCAPISPRRNSLIMTTSPSRKRHRGSRIGHRLLSVSIMAGWVLMPLMPLLAYALVWYDGLT